MQYNWLQQREFCRDSRFSRKYRLSWWHALGQECLGQWVCLRLQSIYSWLLRLQSFPKHRSVKFGSWKVALPTYCNTWHCRYSKIFYSQSWDFWYSHRFSNWRLTTCDWLLYRPTILPRSYRCDDLPTVRCDGKASLECIRHWHMFLKFSKVFTSQTPLGSCWGWLDKVSQTDFSSVWSRSSGGCETSWSTSNDKKIKIKAMILWWVLDLHIL